MTSFVYGQNQAFVVTEREAQEIFDVTQAGRFAIGLGLNSNVPLGSPFSISGGAKTGPFRYSLINSAQVELAYSISSAFELSIAGGIEQYASRFDLDTNPTDNTYDFVRNTIRNFPLLLIARIGFAGNRYWRPEIEAAAGLSFSKVSIAQDTSTDPPKVNSTKALRGHLSVGAGIPWTKHLSLHTSIGYQYQKIGSKQYALTGGSSKVDQKNLSGLFVKGLVRFQF